MASTAHLPFQEEPAFKAFGLQIPSEPALSILGQACLSLHVSLPTLGCWLLTCCKRTGTAKVIDGSGHCSEGWPNTVASLQAIWRWHCHRDLTHKSSTAPCTMRLQPASALSPCRYGQTISCRALQSAPVKLGKVTFQRSDLCLLICAKNWPEQACFALRLETSSSNDRRCPLRCSIAGLCIVSACLKSQLVCLSRVKAIAT